MRRIVLFTITTCALVACGGKNTITATPAIKADVTSATDAMGATSGNVSTSMRVQTLGTDLASAAVAQSGSGIDINGMPDPDTLPPLRLNDAGAPLQSLRERVSSTASTTPANGCIISNGASTPSAVWVAAGAAGCPATATDHVEIYYANGDKVNVTWAETATSFTLKFVVVAGKWTGTTLSFGVTGTSTGTTTGSGTITESGTMKYAGTLKKIDADFDLTVSFSSTSPDSWTMGYKGSATDRVGKTKYNGETTMHLNSSTSSTTMELKGSADLSLLGDSLNVLHTISIVGLDINGTVTNTGATFTVAGEIDWDGAKVGDLKADNNAGVVIAWTDGTQTSFDTSLLFAGLN